MVLPSRQYLFPLRVMCTVSIPAMVMHAPENALNPRIAREIRLMARWSCSMMLLRYLYRRIWAIDTGVTLIGSDLLRHIAQVDGLFQTSLGISLM